jgi:uncharacterized protein YndB with AHSA1/START domain
MVPEQIEREIVIDAPLERVWAALTEAAQFQQWFAFDGAEIDLRPGGAVVMHWKEHGTFHGRVEQVDPLRVFAFRGVVNPDEPPQTGNSTRVELSLTPTAAGTRLRVVESGFRELQMSAAEQAAHAEGNTEGWRGAFAKLQELLGPVPDQITHEIVIDAPVARVWEALTEPDAIRQWFASGGAEVDLRPGGAMVLRWRKHGTTYARIERIEPMRFFSYRWALAPGEQPDAGNSTLVEFRLTPAENGTRLRVVESGFRHLAIAEDGQRRHVMENSDGWQEVFAELASTLQRVPA